MNQLTKECVEWVKGYFDIHQRKKIIVRVSNDVNSVAALAVCCEAVGKDNVFGVVFSRPAIADICSESKMLDDFGVSYKVIEIDDACNAALNSVKIDNIDRTQFRKHLEMSLLYGVASSFKDGLVVGSMDVCKFGLGDYVMWTDELCDIDPFALMTVSEVKSICSDFGLKYECMDEDVQFSFFVAESQSIETVSHTEVEDVLEKYVFSGSLSPIDTDSLEFMEKAILVKLNSAMSKTDYTNIPKFADSALLSAMKQICRNECRVEDMQK
jgi:NAD+ synthase